MTNAPPIDPRLPNRAPAPEELVGLLADGVRRRIVAALVTGGRTLDDLLRTVQHPSREVIEQLRRLEAAGVVEVDGDRYSLVDDIFSRSVRDAAGERLGPLNDLHTQLARRYFFRNRLVQVPSEPWALDVVLAMIAEDFLPGEVYSEREVSTTLYGWHGDYALLRRLLVDHHYLGRDHGRYWRVT